MKGKLLLPILGTAVILSGCSSFGPGRMVELDTIDANETDKVPAFYIAPQPENRAAGRGVADGPDAINIAMTLARHNAMMRLCRNLESTTEGRVTTKSTQTARGASSGTASQSTVFSQSQCRAEVGNIEPIEMKVLQEGNNRVAYVLIEASNVRPVVENTFTAQDQAALNEVQ
jgi:hypothetical protein